MIALQAHAVPEEPETPPPPSFFETVRLAVASHKGQSKFVKALVRAGLREKSQPVVAESAKLDRTADTIIGTVEGS